MKINKKIMYVLFCISMLYSCVGPVEQNNTISTDNNPENNQNTPNQSVQDQTLPNEFCIKEKVMSLVTAFTIENDGTEYGDVTRKIFSLTTTFIYTDVNDKLVMKGKEQIFSWGTKIDFYDADDNYIGAIHENVFKSMFKVYTSYTVLDKNKKKVAESEKTDILKTKIILKDNNGEKIAKIERDLINLVRDTWTVNIYQRDKIDIKILPIIAAYKTYSDNQKNKKSDDD
ncbi:MAG: hypothetical protein WCP92_00195 [bacterium]